MVGRVVAGDPNVALWIDVDAVLVFRPVVSRARAAPALDEVALGVELSNRWHRLAAPHGGLCRFRTFLVVQYRVGPVQHPYVIAAVHGQARDLSENPVLLERLRPERIDDEPRAARHALRLGAPRRHLRAADCDEYDNDGCDSEPGLLHMLPLCRR